MSATKGSPDEPGGVPAELRRLATSSDPEDRAEAGRRRASQAGGAEVDELLLELVLDISTTYVTYETAEALLERRDPAATRVIARACAGADPRDLSIEWLGDAVNDVWLQTGDDLRVARALVAALVTDPDAVVREGAVTLRVRIESGDWPRPSEPPRPPRWRSWTSRLPWRTRP